MNATHLGSFYTSASRTRVRFQFSTHSSAGANVAPNSAFEAADIRIYRAADGAAFSDVQRSSVSGVVMTSPFDSLLGFHAVDIDLTDNSDAGFYTSGYTYAVVLAPDETVDSQTITAVVLAYFEIGIEPVGSVVTDGGNSSTSFKTNRTETANDFWKDCLLLITSGALVGQLKKVTAYDGTTKIITVSGGFTGTPADGVTFLLVNQ